MFNLLFGLFKKKEAKKKVEPLNDGFGTDIRAFRRPTRPSYPHQNRERYSGNNSDVGYMSTGLEYWNTNNQNSDNSSNDTPSHSSGYGHFGGGDFGGSGSGSDWSSSSDSGSSDSGSSDCGGGNSD